MIFRDKHWKQELEALAKEIEAINLGPEPAPDDYFIAERPIFYSAFIIRKMIEDNAVTDKLKGKSFRAYSCRQREMAKRFSWN